MDFLKALYSFSICCLMKIRPSELKVMAPLSQRPFICMVESAQGLAGQQIGGGGGWGGVKGNSPSGLALVSVKQ